jgi:hypothetical protein
MTSDIGRVNMYDHHDLLKKGTELTKLQDKN